MNFRSPSEEELRKEAEARHRDVAGRHGGEALILVETRSLGIVEADADVRGAEQR